MLQLTPREKIMKARITLLRTQPFFGSLAMHLIPIQMEGEEQKARIQTMGVNVYGQLFYNPDYVNSLEMGDLCFVLSHEIMHLALEHFTRIGLRQRKLWNIATDEAINHLLDKEMKVPKGLLCSAPFRNKSSEQIYDELLQQANFTKVYGAGNCSRVGPFDVHFYPGQGESGGEGKGKEDSPLDTGGLEEVDVPKMIREAAGFAKQQGKLPSGMLRLFKDILEPTMNWKELLQKFIMTTLPQDWTYIKPSKRSISVGFYMPTVHKEDIEIVIGVDSSGSISDQEYAQFLTEVYSMVKIIENLKASVLICDAQISEIVEVDSSFDPLRDIQGGGYGGTSCIPVFKWISQEKDENVKLLVYLTDGYIDEPTEDVYSTGYPVLWVVTKKGKTDFLKRNIGNQTIIQMETTEDESQRT